MFSAAMYVETLVADLPVFWASDVIAVLTSVGELVAPKHLDEVAAAVGVHRRVQQVEAR